MPTIYLTGVLKGKSKTLAKRYDFHDGKMDVPNEDDAQKIFKVLRKFYPVSMDEVKKAVEPEAKPEVPSAPQIAKAAGSK